MQQNGHQHPGARCRSDLIDRRVAATIKKIAPAISFFSGLLGLWLRDLVVNGLSIPGAPRLLFGRSIADNLRLPAYNWPFVDVGPDPF